MKNKLKNNSIFLKYTFFLLIFYVSFFIKDGSIAQSFQISSQTSIVHDNCLGFCPKGANDNNIIVDHGVILLSSNLKTKFADWVAYKIEQDNLKGPPRPRNWAKDPLLNDQFTLIPSDYKGLSGSPFLFDRGHQAPLAAFRNHKKWYAVNYLSNITPQKRHLNQGAWNRLEAKERELINNYSTVYVLTGPYFSKEEKTSGPSCKRIDYKIPSGYWKIILVEDKEEFKVISFIFPQETPKTANYCKYNVSPFYIEKMSGLKFFNNNSKIKEDGLNKEIGCDKD